MRDNMPGASSSSKVGVASANFGFLASHDPLLARLGGFAEHYALHDPNTALIKLRQLSEALLRRVAANIGLDAGPEIGQFELLRDLEGRRVISRDVADLFHHLRRLGNDAAHAFS